MKTNSCTSNLPFARLSRITSNNKSHNGCDWKIALRSHVDDDVKKVRVS